MRVRKKKKKQKRMKRGAEGSEKEEEEGGRERARERGKDLKPTEYILHIRAKTNTMTEIDI